jgi:6-phosphogluconolactonase
MKFMTQSFFFACGYTKPVEPGIHAFSFNEETGAMTSVGSYIGIDSPSFLVVHPNKKWLYVVSETGQSSHGVLGSVWSFRFEREPFFIEPINQVTTQGDWPCHLGFDRLGKWLVATNYGTGNAAIYPIHEDGSLGEMTDFVQHQGTGPNTARQEGPHAHSSIFTPDNRFLIIADLGADHLAVYTLDHSNGKLSLHEFIKTHPGAGPRHFAFHPNGKWFYAANELNSTVTCYEYNASNKSFLEKGSLSTIPTDSPENIVADIHINSAGNRLYISNRGHNSIAVFDINNTGVLALVSIPSCGGNWPRNFALSQNENFVLVANQYSNEVCALPILKSKDALGSPVSSVSVMGASCVQFV